jgi:hypothetical protein
MTQNIMTSALEASGPTIYFLGFSILLDGLAHISAIFLLKMQKKSEIGSPYCTYTVYTYTVYSSVGSSLQTFGASSKGEENKKKINILKRILFYHLKCIFL